MNESKRTGWTAIFSILNFHSRKKWREKSPFTKGGREVGERILREFFHGSRPTDLALIFRPFRSFPWPRPRLPPPRPRLPPPQRRIFTILRVEKSPFSTRRATPSLRVVAHRSPPPNRPPRFLRVSSRLLLPLLLLCPDSLKSRGDAGISSDPQCVRASPSLP